MRLQRGSDGLLAHRDAIEDRLFERSTGCSGWPTVTGALEGERGDCPLPTLGLALTRAASSGARGCFAGNVVESATLAEMLESLGAPKGALVVKDHGVATDDRVA